MCFYDVEPADVSRLTTPRARKQHKCGECGAVIFPGERYVSVTMIIKGECISCKECQRCADLRQRVIDHELAEGCELQYADPGYNGHLLMDAARELKLI